VLRKYAFALRPGWLLLHVLTVAAVVTMILLGRWQLHVSESKHFSLQNFGYSIQWWLFSAFALFFWWRILRDHARHLDARNFDARHLDARNLDPAGAAPVTPPESADEPEADVPYRRYVMPQTSDANDDPEIKRYNDYLARLNARRERP
jgi:hypothetical protein